MGSFVRRKKVIFDGIEEDIGSMIHINSWFYEIHIG